MRAAGELPGGGWRARGGWSDWGGWTKTGFCILFQNRWTKTAVCMHFRSANDGRLVARNSSTCAFEKRLRYYVHKKVCKRQILSSVSRKVCKRLFLSTGLRSDSGPAVLRQRRALSGSARSPARLLPRPPVCLSVPTGRRREIAADSRWPPTPLLICIVPARHLVRCQLVYRMRGVVGGFRGRLTCLMLSASRAFAYCWRRFADAVAPSCRRDVGSSRSRAASRRRAPGLRL